MVGYGVKNSRSIAAKTPILIARIKVVLHLFNHANDAIICDGNQIFLIAR